MLNLRKVITTHRRGCVDGIWDGFEDGSDDGFVVGALLGRLEGTGLGNVDGPH